MRENLDAAIRLILAYEGGYTNMARDPGGPTNLGITQATLAAWRRDDVTPEQVRELQPDEAGKIYRQQYAAPVRFDDLPAGLDLCVLDCAVNSGPARAVKLLQGVVGADTDGVIGVHTMEALACVETRTLIEAYCDARLAFLRRLRVWDAFGVGWTNRVRKVLRDSLALDAGKAVLPSIPLAPTAQAKGTGAVKATWTASGRTAIAAFASVAGTALVSVGDGAGDARAVLEPFADVPVVHWLLLACAVASATATLVVALRRAGEGATT